MTTTVPSTTGAAAAGEAATPDAPAGTPRDTSGESGGTTRRRWWQSWRYRDDGGRDLRLDLLRGYALIAMSITHTGLDSWWRPVTGGAVFLVNAAEVFFAVSGLTLGVVSARAALRTSVERVLRRTWVVYLAVVAIGLGLTVLTIEDGVRWMGFDAESGGDVVSQLAAVLTLREAPHGSDVLVAYVVYLGITPLLLWLLSRGRTGVLLAGAGGVYLLSQVAPASVELPVAAFRNLAANNLVFVVPLVLGWHRDTLHRWAGSLPAAVRRGADVAALAVVAAGVALGVLYATGFGATPALGRLLDGGFGEREAAMPVVPLLVVALYLCLLWVVVTWAWRGLHRALGWLLLPIGQASLFTYGVHLLLIPLLFLVPLVPRNEDDRLVTTAVLAGYVATIYGAVLVRRVLRSAVFAAPRPWPALARRIPGVGTGALVVAVAVYAATLPAPLLPDEGEREDEEWLDEELDDEFDGEFDEDFDEDDPGDEFDEELDERPDR